MSEWPKKTGEASDDYKVAERLGHELGVLIGQWHNQWNAKGGGTRQEAVMDAEKFFARVYPEEISVQIDSEGYMHIQAQSAVGKEIIDIKQKSNSIRIL